MGRKFNREDKTPANRVWIELDNPRKVKRSGEEIAAAANKMLKKLGITWEHFRWSDHRCVYQLVHTESHTFVDLTDSGEWFNLDLIVEDVK